MKDAKDRAWARLTNPKGSEEANSDTIEVNGNEETGETIQVADRTKAKTNGSKKMQAAVNGSKGASSKGRRFKAKKGDPAENPWTGLLEAKLERKPAAEGEDESGEITGKVLITDLRDDKGKIWEETLTCLFCRKPL